MYFIAIQKVSSTTMWWPNQKVRCGRTTKRRWDRLVRAKICSFPAASPHPRGPGPFTKKCFWAPGPFSI